MCIPVTLTHKFYILHRIRRRSSAMQKITHLKKPITIFTFALEERGKQNLWISGARWTLSPASQVQTDPPPHPLPPRNRSVPSPPPHPGRVFRGEGGRGAHRTERVKGGGEKGCMIPIWLSQVNIRLLLFLCPGARGGGGPGGALSSAILPVCHCT